MKASNGVSVLEQRCSGLSSASSMASLLYRSTKVLSICGRKTTPIVPCTVSSRLHIKLAAKRREVETDVSFPDLYDGLQDRVFNEDRLLPFKDTLVLVENVRSSEQVVKCLDLIQKHLQNRAEGSTSDWHFRKKYYLRLVQHAINMDKPELIYKIMGNLDAYQISTYFAKEVIQDLGKRGATAAVLTKIAEVVKVQRGPGDKGARAAYKEVMNVLKERGAGQEQMQPVQQALKEMAAAAAAASAAADAGPAPPAVAAGVPATPAAPTVSALV